MNKWLAEQVRHRAMGRCEYCRIGQRHFEFPFHIEHVVAKQHRGATELENLALSCSACNFHKGPNLSGVDPVIGNVVRLFHPRQNRWDEHFEMDGAFIRGRSEIGRATVAVLAMNADMRVNARSRLIAEFGTFE